MGIEKKTDICKACGKTIDSYERAVVIEGGLICFKCEQKSPDVLKAAARVSIIPRKAPVTADGTAFEVNGTKPLARLMDRIVVHASPAADSDAICGLEIGDVVEIHKQWKAEGGWMEIRMPGGLMGYMPSDTKVMFLERAKLKAKEVDIFDKPTLSGTPAHKLIKKTLFWIFTKAPAEDPSWVMVRLDSGQQGYIQSSTKVSILARPTVPAIESAGHDIVVGAIWCIVGIAVTAGTYSAVAETGGVYFIFYGPVIFGGWQFLKGLFRAISMEQAPVYTGQ